MKQVTQRNKNTLCLYLYVASRNKQKLNQYNKTTKLTGTEKKLVVIREKKGGGSGEISERDLEVPVTSYKSMLQGCSVQQRGCSQ